MTDFNQVVVRNLTKQRNNIHLGVHPFRRDDWIRAFHGPKDNDEHFKKEPLPPWQRELLDALWAGLPGLTTVFFQNGEITLQHRGVFDDHDIIEAASAIIRPYLETALALEQMQQDTSAVRA